MVQLLSYNHYKGNISCTADALLTKFDMLQHIMVIYNPINFHQIPFTGSLVIVPGERDGQMDKMTDGGAWRKLYRSAFRRRDSRFIAERMYVIIYFKFSL